MKPRVTLATAVAPDGTRLELVAHDRDFLINSDGLPLMSTRLHHSEEELARLGCRAPRTGNRVLVGGLGLGFTLRATLDLLPPEAKVVLVEFVPEVVAWKRGPLRAVAGDPLADPRVEVVVDDVAAVLRRNPGGLDVVILDVDNGPSLRPGEPNARLYAGAGLGWIAKSLRPGGRVAIWAAEDDDRGFEARLSGVGLTPSKELVPARKGLGGKPHAVYLGEAPAGPPRRGG